MTDAEELELVWERKASSMIKEIYDAGYKAGFEAGRSWGFEEGTENALEESKRKPLSR